VLDKGQGRFFLVGIWGHKKGIAEGVCNVADIEKLLDLATPPIEDEDDYENGTLRSSLPF
jgi:hypothetical protein